MGLLWSMTSSRTKLRVGLIGCGGIFRLSHLPSYEALTHLIAIEAIADPYEPNLLQAAQSLRLGPDACFNDPREMLRAVPLDVVVIATPHHLHREQLLQVAEAGVACIGEKPLVLEPSDLVNIEAAFRAAGRDCSVVHNYLYTSGMQAALADLKGESPYFAQTRAVFSKAFPAPANDWRFDRDAGGGALNDTCYHEIYLTEALMGSPVTEVQGRIRSARFGRSADDLVEIHFTHANGQGSNVLVGWCLPSPGAEHFITVYGNDRSWRVAGRGRGLTRFDRIEGSWQDVVSTKETEIQPRQVMHGHFGFFEAAFGAALAGRPFPHGLAAARRQVDILSAVRRASAERTTVVL